MTTDDNILRINQVTAKVGLSRATIYNRMADGTFPKQIKLGVRLSGWLASEVQQWIQDQMKASRPALPANAANHTQAA